MVHVGVATEIFGDVLLWVSLLRPQVLCDIVRHEDLVAIIKFNQKTDSVIRL
jgi:hypothetical protein